MNESSTALRILIVDDSPAMRSILRDAFELCGHRIVAETETMDETMNAYAAHKPDVVTLDLSLTECDGLSVLKAIRNLDERANVLVISANEQKKVQEAARAAGAIGYLAKPFQISDLMDAAARVALRRGVSA